MSEVGTAFRTKDSLFILHCQTPYTSSRYQLQVSNSNYLFTLPILPSRDLLARTRDMFQHSSTLYIALGKKTKLQSLPPAHASSSFVHTLVSAAAVVPVVVPTAVVATTAIVSVRRPAVVVAVVAASALALAVARRRRGTGLIPALISSLVPALSTLVATAAATLVATATALVATTALVASVSRGRRGRIPVGASAGHAWRGRGRQARIVPRVARRWRGRPSWGRALVLPVVVVVVPIAIAVAVSALATAVLSSLVRPVVDPAAPALIATTSPTKWRTAVASARVSASVLEHVNVLAVKGLGRHLHAAQEHRLVGHSGIGKVVEHAAAG